jgi:hypothetical protein
LSVIVSTPRGIELHLPVIVFTPRGIQLHLSVIVYTPRGIQLHFYVFIMFKESKEKVIVRFGDIGALLTTIV